MAAALHRLPSRPKPSRTSYRPALDGLATICEFVGAYIRQSQLPSLKLVEGKAAPP
jgi:hypothetical protein